MKRTVNNIGEYICQFDIQEVKNSMTLEDRKLVERKTQELIGSMSFRDATDRILAERMFEMGYLASHIDYFKNEVSG